MRSWVWLMCGGLACATGEVTPAGPPATPGADPTLAAPMTALLAWAGPLSEPCHPDALRGAQGEQGAAAIERACGPFIHAFDAGVDAAMGHTAAGNALLNNAARMSEDASQLQRSLRRPEHEAEVAELIEHLRASSAAVADSVKRLREAADKGFSPMFVAIRDCADPDEVRRALVRQLDGDRQRVDTMERQLHAYGVLQGARPDLVRGRALRTQVAIAASALRASREGWAAACPSGGPLEAERFWLGGYLDAVEAANTRYAAHVQALVDGQVRSVEDAQGRMDDWKQVVAEWAGLRQAQAERLGGKEAADPQSMGLPRL